MNNHDEVPGKGDYKRSRIAEMMKHRFLGGGPVEPPDVDYSAADQRIIMGEKARGVSTYRGPELMDYDLGLWGKDGAGWMAYQTGIGYNRVGEYGLTWVGWLEKYSSYAKREGEGEATPIFQQTIVEELMRADADARAQETWFGDEPGEGI